MGGKGQIGYQRQHTFCAVCVYCADCVQICANCSVCAVCAVCNIPPYISRRSLCHLCPNMCHFCCLCHLCPGGRPKRGWEGQPNRLKSIGCRRQRAPFCVCVVRVVCVQICAVCVVYAICLQICAVCAVCFDCPIPTSISHRYVCHLCRLCVCVQMCAVCAVCAVCTVCAVYVQICVVCAICAGTKIVRWARAICNRFGIRKPITDAEFSRKTSIVSD